jgi:hypothetical protein
VYTGTSVANRPEVSMAESTFMERKPGALTLSEDDRRVLAVWAADCEGLIATAPASKHWVAAELAEGSVRCIYLHWALTHVVASGLATNYDSFTQFHALVLFTPWYFWWLTSIKGGDFFKLGVARCPYLIWTSESG